MSQIEIERSYVLLVKPLSPQFLCNCEGGAGAVTHPSAGSRSFASTVPLHQLRDVGVPTGLPTRPQLEARSPALCHTTTAMLPHPPICLARPRHLPLTHLPPLPTPPAGHGIPQEEIDRAFATGQEFLNKSQEFKEQWPFNPDSYLGYRGPDELETVTGEGWVAGCMESGLSLGGGSLMWDLVGGGGMSVRVTRQCAPCCASSSLALPCCC